MDPRKPCPSFGMLPILTSPLCTQTRYHEVHAVMRDISTWFWQIPTSHPQRWPCPCTRPAMRVCVCSQLRNLTAHSSAPDAYAAKTENVLRCPHLPLHLFRMFASIHTALCVKPGQGFTLRCITRTYRSSGATSGKPPRCFTEACFQFPDAVAARFSRKFSQNVVLRSSLLALYS